MKKFINKNFFLIWSGKLVSMVGDRFYTLVLALWVLEKSNSPLTMGIVLVASALPAFLISFISGAYVDLKNKKNIIIITDLLRGGLICLVAILELAGILQVWHIIAVSIIISFLNAFFDPAIKSLIPEVVEEKDLPNANALEQLISGVSNIVGPILGAVAIGTIGFVGGFFINGISFIISAFFEMYIEASNTRKEITKDSNIKKDIKDGFVFIFTNKLMLKVMAIIALVHFAYGSFILIMPFLAKTISNNSALTLGILEGFLGVGMIIGATKLNIKELRKKKNNLLILLFFVLGLTYLIIGSFVFYEINAILLYSLIIIFMGISISNAASFWQLILQLETPADKRGRVFGIVSMLANISMPIAYGAIGILLEFVDYSIYLIGLGIIFVILTVIWRNAFSKKDCMQKNTMNNRTA